MEKTKESGVEKSVATITVMVVVILILGIIAGRFAIVWTSVNKLKNKLTSPDGTTTAIYEMRTAPGFFGGMNVSGEFRVVSNSGQELSRFDLTERQAIAFNGGGASIYWTPDNSSVEFKGDCYFESHLETTFRITFDLPSGKWDVDEREFETK